MNFRCGSCKQKWTVIIGQKNLQDLKVESEKSLNKKKFREHGLEKIRSLLETRKKIHESLN
jgi:hypothetical protein